VSPDGFSTLKYQTCLFGCLLGVVGTLFFLGGLAGHIGNRFLEFAVVAALAGTVVFFLYSLFLALRERGRVASWLRPLILVILVVEVVLCLVPPTARDELTHHLAIPRLYVRAGRIIEIPFAPYSYYPMLLDMLYTPWIQWGYDSVPKLVHALFGFLTALLLYAYLARRLSPVYGLLGIFFFISIPAILRVSNWAYVDLGVAFFSAASLICLLRWLEDTNSRRWLVLGGLSAGFAAATKPNGIVALTLLVLLAAYASAKEDRKPTQILFPPALFSAIAALSFLPWALKNWFQTGNPFYPFFASFFAGRPTSTTGGASFVGLGLLAKRELLYGESWWQIAALPLRLFFFGADDKPQHFDGVLSPLLILLLPWAFKGKWREEKKLFLSFVVLYLAYALFLVDLRVRYVLPIVPPLVVLLVFGIHNVYLRIRRPFYLFAGLTIFAALHGVYLWQYFRRVAPMAYVTGRESRDAYLTRVLPEYPAIQYINQKLPANAKIYLLFVGRRAYYCERDYFHDGGDLPGFLLAAIQSAKTQADVYVRLEEQRLTHFLVREDLFGRFLRDNLTPNERSVWESFVANHVRRVFLDRGYAVYQVYG
jgi:hypothetical protein